MAKGQLRSNKEKKKPKQVKKAATAPSSSIITHRIEPRQPGKR
ncbi:MAG: hypothetical protein AB7O31_18030 [Burkholderiales bacterium]